MKTQYVLYLTGILIFATGCSDDLSTKDLSDNNGQPIYLKSLAHPEESVQIAGNTICHIPPGNPSNAHTIRVGKPAVQHHIDHHGDYLGPCRDNVVLPPVVEEPPVVVDPPEENPPVDSGEVF